MANPNLLDQFIQSLKTSKLNNMIKESEIESLRAYFADYSDEQLKKGIDQFKLNASDEKKLKADFVRQIRISPESMKRLQKKTAELKEHIESKKIAERLLTELEDIPESDKGNHRKGFWGK